jgi:hypothetical protein
MEGKFYKILLTQIEETFDLGNLAEVTHHILYDSGTGVALDITAEANQGPLFSEVTPYEVFTDQRVGVLEKYLSGEERPIKDWDSPIVIPHIVGFEAKELVGEKYNPIRDSMVALRNSKMVLDDRLRIMKDCCLRAGLVRKSGRR